VRAHLLLITVLIGVSLAQSLAQVDTTEFHGDETRWLNRGRYLQELLAPRGLTWSDHFLTRGQPPGGSYLMGLGLFVQGRPLEPNRIWVFGVEHLWNIHHGNMPAQADLTAGRRTNAVVGALAVGIVYLLGCQLTTRLGGIFGALVLAFHPLMIRLSSQALADAFLVLVLAFTGLAACWLAERPTWPRALLLGALLGLGGLIKLSPLLLALPFAGLGGLLLVRPHLPWSWLRGIPGSTSVGLGERLLPLPVVAFTAFVAGYPYLWPDPISRTYNLFAFRIREMTLQQEVYSPSVAIRSWEESVEWMMTTLGQQFSVAGRLGETVPFLAGVPVLLDLVLAVGGMGALLWLIWHRGPASPQALAGVVVFGQAALIAGGLRVGYERYYLPLVFVEAVVIGVLAGVAGTAVRDLIYGAHSLSGSPHSRVVRSP
jgi:hypothetical protein